MAPIKNKSDSKTLEKQRALARERQRRRRAKLTEEQLEIKKAKDRERYAKLKTDGQIKKVKDMTPREHRLIKKKWRERKNRSNLKKRQLNSVIEMSPPNSEEEEETKSEQKKRGRKCVRRDRSKAYRKIRKQEEEIKKLRNQVQKYKMRLKRSKIPQQNEASTPLSPSPMKKVKNLISKQKVSPQIKKQLFLGFVLKKQLKSQVNKVNPKSKSHQLISKAIGTDVLRKYKVQKHFKDIVTYKMNKTNANLNFQYERKRKKCLSDTHEIVVRQFFEDDTVSRMCPGKRDFITKNKIKRQRRVLLESKGTLYKRFMNEFGIKMSYSTFSRLCPFWVTEPKASDRETCACIRHQNFELKIHALKKLKVISESNVNDVLKSVVCDIKNEFCMMGYCENCEGKRIKHQYEENFKVKYHQWKTVVEDKVIKGKTRKVKKTAKVKLVNRVSDLCQEVNNDLVNFKKHVFYHIHQCTELKLLKMNLKSDEMVCRLDFSENYLGKHAVEVQSAHFGAAKKQMTLNTVVVYLRNQTGELETKSFCTVSDHMDHQAHAVWAHMDPILKNIASQYPTMKAIHFFSDGPSNQYKNRYNIYLMRTKLPEYFKRVKAITWNYMETGHGKGPMDGIGGVLKRRADDAVRHGIDITSASDFVKSLKDRTKIKLIEVDSSAVEKLKQEVKQAKILPIEKISQSRQITWHENNTMYSRSMSCFSCEPCLPAYCDHYTITKIFVEKLKKQKAKKEAKPTRSVNPKKRKKVYHMIYSSSSSDTEDKCFKSNPKIKSEEVNENARPSTGTTSSGPIKTYLQACKQKVKHGTKTLRNEESKPLSIKDIACLLNTEEDMDVKIDK